MVGTPRDQKKYFFAIPGEKGALSDFAFFVFFKGKICLFTLPFAPAPPPPNSSAPTSHPSPASSWHDQSLRSLELKGNRKITVLGALAS
jgi:hypothetical protein